MTSSAQAKTSSPSFVRSLQLARQDRVDKNGKLTLRHRTRLHHIGMGHAQKGKRVIMLVASLDVRVLSQDGELLRRLTLNPSRDYQPQG